MKMAFRGLLAIFLLSGMMVQAGAVRDLAGFTTTVYGPNDDGTYPCTGPDVGVPPGTPISVPIGFNVNFYGNVFSNLYINNNGNITFDAPLGDFTPFGLVDTKSQIIAPFFADVDTRAGNLVTFGNDVVDGHPAFGVNWIDVGYFDSHVDKLNSFQLVLIDRSDRHDGDFDIEFNYDQIQWECGDASGGTNGLGGSSAVAGFSNGSGLPGTSLQLNGSAIPGKFLDINANGLIHNSLNTNVPGRYIFPIVNLTNLVLNVQRFSQGDSRWASQAYGGTSSTIQQQGSALCCLAMALTYAGVATDPGALNTLLASSKDFAGNDVNWDAATRDASSQALRFHAYRTTDAQYLSQSLNDGFPVIVGVDFNNNGDPGHFVVVKGEQNGHFIINDPGHVNATNLDYYGNDFETRGYVGDPPGDMSALDVSVGNAAEVLVVDPLGRQTGYDPGSDTVLEGIPQSSHFADCPENNDLTGTSGTNTSRIIQIFQPLQGHYQIYLIGRNAGIASLDLRSYLQNGSEGISAGATGSIEPNTIKTYQAIVNATGVFLESFTNQYVWTASPTNGPLPLTVQFTAPAVDSSGNTITNWYWTFGDGTISTDSNPSHQYVSGGVFFPSVVAADDGGNSVVSFGASIVLPTVQYSATPANGQVPLTVQFNATNIDSIGHVVSSWTWDFGDSSGTSMVQNPSHPYSVTGMYQPQIATTDDIGLAVSGFGPAISVTVPVNSLGLVLNGDFESGDLTDWSSSGDAFVDDGTYTMLAPYAGTYFAALGTIGFPGYISQTLPTTAGATYLLSLWLDSPDGATPNEFSTSWNHQTIFGQSNISAIGWTNLQFVVKATASSTVLRFDFRDDPSYLGLDNVSVVPVPKVVSLSLKGSDLVINGSNGQSNSACVTLMSTNLTANFSQWTPVATNVLTSDGNFTFTATNAVDPQAQRRFYIFQIQ